MPRALCGSAAAAAAVAAAHFAGLSEIGLKRRRMKQQTLAGAWQTQTDASTV
eukprot:CAMPEP_0172801870 /NCGR_PEP_ID=MMETSP1075-20121228/3508_1 /TAXON_ID=2916 /ORGANISM="Ceratium fusus, Strain PA161109" /LENGTH=51 /DNA_ID=CAMNT_0013640039 /DNA_START=330 /DNA_END=485 /DNA_ORIENTATION=+